MSTPDLIAHRGYALHYPENTLIALEAAIAAGARFLEVDVQLSADRVPLLLHDRTLEQMCGVKKAAREHTWAELVSLHATQFPRFGYRFAQNRLARLSDLVELLAREPHVTAFVEVKRAAIEHFGVAGVLDAITPVLQPVAARCVLISFSSELLLAARNAMGKVPRAWLGLGAILESWHERWSGWYSRLQPEYVFCDTELLPRFGRFRTRGARLAVYEVTDPKQALSLARRGADFIETFAIGELRAGLALAQGAK